MTFRTTSVTWPRRSDADERLSGLSLLPAPPAAGAPDGRLQPCEALLSFTREAGGKLRARLAGASRIRAEPVALTPSHAGRSQYWKLRANPVAPGLRRPLTSDVAISPGVIPHSPAGDQPCLPDPPLQGEGDRRRRRWWRGVTLSVAHSTSGDAPPSRLAGAPPPLAGEDLSAPCPPRTGEGDRSRSEGWWGLGSLPALAGKVRRCRDSPPPRCARSPSPCRGGQPGSSPCWAGAKTPYPLGW
ncbi:hypothetical protein HNO88_003459 [Novosphingobium chloroacetimidivorans]|uniref:Uncharacterized protein n=1 Tax=Novosphingobium chloroacetimidivorans TaxID=1428314 RepID=A0A7W7KDJ8_9SPHN|nr:hypothetical protein [Novosphingobium chloroacetimidivorans]